jgi:hypothetical protein
VQHCARIITQEIPMKHVLPAAFAVAALAAASAAQAQDNERGF